MDFQLQGKAAVVTGASKGIGAGIAKALAAEGARVVVNYNHGKAGAEKVVREIEAAGGQAAAVQGNVAVAADVKRLFETAVSLYGSVEVVVNNAGVYGFGPVDGFSEEDYRYQFDTNVLGVFLSIRESLKHFPVTGGSIINISSQIVTGPKAYSSVYAATKAALDLLSESLAIELAPRKIRVNVVSPGPVETEGLVAAGAVGSDFVNRLIADTPLGRMGQPEDIAETVVYLASRKSGWVTGERIGAAGGLK
ncbi:MAG TPA: glucose 1-dehydrogenase [Puia sp.]|nr:glucose 1-dehydrogenase [Puia sp.]